MLLAGDVGGTKILLGLFERAHRRPIPFSTRSYATLSFSSFDQVLEAFVRDIARPFVVEAAAIGVAGPVLEQSATLTNIPWTVTAAEVRTRFDTSQAQLLNDLQAMAYSVEVLSSDELSVLQRGKVNPRGTAAVIAAGTGLGQAMLHRVGERYIPVPSEGGHADFAARSDREMDFVRMLRERYGRAEVEHILSGPGLYNLHRFTHNDEQCESIRGIPTEDYPAAISEAALDNRCPRCVESLSMFVSAYGAEAGNLALRAVATGGIFIGGGIAPKILPALTDGRFMEAFRAKPPMTDLLSDVPVKVILASEAGLLGAAVYAQSYLT